MGSKLTGVAGEKPEKSVKSIQLMSAASRDGRVDEAVECVSVQTWDERRLFSKLTT